MEKGGGEELRGLWVGMGWREVTRGRTESGRGSGEGIFLFEVDVNLPIIQQLVSGRTDTITSTKKKKFKGSRGA